MYRPVLDHVSIVTCCLQPKLQYLFKFTIDLSVVTIHTIIEYMTNHVHGCQHSNDVTHQLMQINMLVDQDECKGHVGATNQGEAFTKHYDEHEDTIKT